MLLQLIIIMVVVITVKVYFHSDLALLLTAGAAVLRSVKEAA
jgi:hypothetical protein